MLLTTFTLLLNHFRQDWVRICRRCAFCFADVYCFHKCSCHYFLSHCVLYFVTQASLNNFQAMPLRNTCIFKKMFSIMDSLSWMTSSLFPLLWIVKNVIFFAPCLLLHWERERELNISSIISLVIYITSILIMILTYRWRKMVPKHWLLSLGWFNYSSVKKEMGWRI